MKKFVIALCLLGGLSALAQFDLRKVDPLKVGRDAAKMVKGVAGIGLKDERNIGDSVAVEIVGRYGGLVRDEAITKRVNLIGKSLAHYCDRPELAYRFGVLDSPDVNAFSAPGGYVFITRGLYDMLGSDDQLAGVLAHEIAHISERHALKIIERGQFLEGAAGVASAAGAATSEGELARYSSSIGEVTQTLFEKGFDPQTEYEADSVGRKLAATTAYASDGLKQCLESLQAKQSGKKTFFSTHPPLARRIAKLNE